ncbi:MAG: roadblock/LC7 domain-containing protein [Planctomycetota bacterium]|nr:MAG: roadblock/LC7 domain-containing protein [Planctomycetota bacterium]
MIGKNSEQMRETRLVFYRDDVDRINDVLEEFLKLSGAKANILIDKEGHAVTQAGLTSSLNVDTLSALVAASFAATREMARLLGEEEFTILSHQGKNDHIQLTLIADRCILCTMFDDSTTVGMVRLYAAEASKKLHRIFDTIARRTEAPAGESIAADFGDQAESALDDVFGA